MRCPKCNSENVNAQVVVKQEEKKHGIIWWVCIGCWWVPVKWIGFFGIALLFKIFKKKKTVSKESLSWVCNNCGNHWKG